MGEILGKNALVIEDDDDIRGLLEIVLAQMGFVVSSVDTGHKGIERARTESPDFITLDVGLPDIDGIAVLTQLRTFYAGKVVMITARGEQADHKLALAAGASGYLLKPFRPKALREQLAAILEQP